MTQLFINGQEVVLPEKFSCKFVNENPLFTKAGDYTLNITLSLENPVNTKIFKHINRINSLSRFENRTAILVSDLEVIIKGKEVILAYSNKEVQIQIVAGNSSLNYLIGNDLNLRSLNLGTAVINKNEIVPNLKKNYPEVDFHLLPFYDPDSDFVGNRYTYGMNQARTGWVLRYAYDGEAAPKLTLHDDSSHFYEYMPEDNNYIRYPIVYENYRPQPYIGAILKKVFSALGYEFENSLDSHSIYKFAYIVHANDTLAFAKMLPNWSVSKLLEEIESLFDCTIIVDNAMMTAKLIFNHHYYNDTSEENVIMLDDFEADIEDDDEKMILEKNISYNLPDSEYYKYQNLPKEITDALHVINTGYPTDSQNIEEIATWIGNRTTIIINENPHNLYKSLALQFIEYIEGNEAIAKVVNDYLPLKNNNSENIDLRLDIIPAEFFVKPWTMYYFTQNSDIFSMVWQLPIARSHSEPVIAKQEGSSLVTPMVQDFVEGKDNYSAIEDNNTASQMSIAFYNSTYNDIFNQGGITTDNNGKIPFSFVRFISERVKLTDKQFYQLSAQNGVYVNPLSLSFLYNEIYSKTDKVDTSKTYKIRFLNPTKKLDPKRIFIIGNRKFYCKKIERSINIDGFEDIIYGEFYAEKD
jgi:hypothetical protein